MTLLRHADNGIILLLNVPVKLKVSTPNSEIQGHLMNSKPNHVFFCNFICYVSPKESPLSYQPYNTRAPISPPNMWQRLLVPYMWQRL